MPITKRQITIALSVYLAALSALAAYALHSSHVYSLPIPDIICALTLALPPLAGIVLETVLSLHDSLAQKGQVQTSRIFQITITAFLIFETVLATLAGTHISPPGSLDCALRERWEELFRAKDGEKIVRIQDGFACCGLRSPRDMAFPFPDARHGSDACVVRYERAQACMDPWREEERKVAIMLLVVPLAVFVWKIAILLSPSSSSAFLPSAIRLPSEDSVGGGSRPRGAIEYHDVEEGAEEEGGDSVRAEVNRLNKDSNVASYVESGRAKAKNGLWQEHERWREAGEGA
ncbi:hypothetical protein B0A55_00333 [Friedmanniomyces simplex]|uniref:Tetraspanin Tsp3 n=1 Tax=Friedmanniomyces simplex TaxID=329884 RepID=A0A4U0Y6Y5_9PEZI|nr:hypothetical protein B0A55_00333 [Friedmanniomyces simplex]